MNLSQLFMKISKKELNWKKKAWEKQIKHSEWIEMNSSYCYDSYIILHILQLIRNFKLTSEHVERLKLEKDLLSNKKKFLIEILHHKEKCLIWNFLKIKFINKEMISFQKIHTVSYKAWQVLKFSILKKLVLTIRIML